MRIIAILVLVAVQSFANGLTENGSAPQNPLGAPPSENSMDLQKGQVQMLGAGSLPCSQALSHMNGQNEALRMAFYSFAQGYASAASAVTGKMIFKTPQRSLEFVKTVVSQVCQQSPSMQFGVAVDQALQLKLGQAQNP